MFSVGSLPKREDGSQATVGSGARTKVHVPIISHTGRQDTSCVPWHMVQDFTAPTKALLPVDVCQLVVGGGGTPMRNILFSHNAGITHVEFFVFSGY